MKKYLVILVVLLIAVTGCGKKFKAPNKLGNDEGLVLYYVITAPSMSGSPSTKISLYTDKRMVLEKTNTEFKEENSSKTITITDEEYKKITDYGFSEDFLTLSGDLSGPQMEGGGDYYIEVYYDGTSFKTGGQNIDNKVFNDLAYLLSNYILH